MGKNRKSAWKQLSEDLTMVERTAADAVVPGELYPWCDQLADDLRRARHSWLTYGEEERELRKQVFRDDRALGHRVGALTEEFATIDQELTALQRRARWLLESDLRRPAASEEPTDRVEKLRRRTLAWVVAARAHHGEVGSLLVEAVNRDRGVAD